MADLMPYGITASTAKYEDLPYLRPQTILLPTHVLNSEFVTQAIQLRNTRSKHRNYRNFAPNSVIAVQYGTGTLFHPSCITFRFGCRGTQRKLPRSQLDWFGVVRSQWTVGAHAQS
jgi:hypothetical protein